MKTKNIKSFSGPLSRAVCSTRNLKTIDNQQSELGTRKITPMKKLSITAAIAVATMFAAASAQAIPITYVYTGNPFTVISDGGGTGPYNTSDSVTGSVELSTPLGDSFNGSVTPIAFSFSDGVQTITNSSTLTTTTFLFQTDSSGAITHWFIVLENSLPSGATNNIDTSMEAGLSGDTGRVFEPGVGEVLGANGFDPGTWNQKTSSVPDTGSSLALLSLSTTALGVAGRRFKRVAA